MNASLDVSVVAKEDEGNKRTHSGCLCGNAQRESAQRAVDRRRAGMERRRSVSALAWFDRPMDAGMLEVLGGAEVFADVRLERVEAVRRAIADGSYQVSAEALAEKLMGYVLSEVR